ncbi:MAG: lactate utilization protein C [Gemmataceae bacterium]
MPTSEESFLQRVRQAVVEGNRAGHVVDKPQRGTVGYQGAGADPMARLRDQFTAAGGHFHAVADRQAAVAAVCVILQQHPIRKVLLGHGKLLDALPLAPALQAAGWEVITLSELQAQQGREELFAADAGITGVDHVIAETGTLAVACRPDDPRSLSLLPPLHIAVVERSQLVPDLFDLFEAIAPATRPMPSCLTLITGPSKTGDIELRLVTGVHGPGEVHLVLVDGERET